MFLVISIISLSFSLLFFFIGFIINKTERDGEGVPFQVFGFYFLIATIVAYLERS